MNNVAHRSTSHLLLNNNNKSHFYIVRYLYCLDIIVLFVFLDVETQIVYSI